MSSNNWTYKVELSAIATILGIILLFSGAVIVTLIAPGFVDPTWTQPTSRYQVQMYEIADPNIYFSSLRSDSTALQAVYHLKKDYSILAFEESESTRILASKDLEKYVTKFGDPTLKLTSNLLMLRKPVENKAQAEEMQKTLQAEWEKAHPKSKEEGLQKPAFEILELYEPEGTEAFAAAQTDRIIENWVDKNFVLIESTQKQPFHNEPGFIYVSNPREYRVTYFKFGKNEGWKYDPENGTAVANVEDLKHHPLGFRSRKELIQFGEHLYAIEGCWYCHTDQTRTLVQDVTLNGSDSFPAPPSSANEYIYQRITFPGTRRIGPDLSRVGVKRPSRDWHQSHFWSPKTASKGSIMPAFQHLFDADPRGTGARTSNIPNYKFEALFQYLMTKGTRITPPTEAWWLGKDPVMTKEIIEGRKVNK